MQRYRFTFSGNNGTFFHTGQFATDQDACWYGHDTSKQMGVELTNVEYA